MKLSQKLQVKQSQSLVMTPQLVQSIKLLQLSSSELQDFIQTEIEKNPLLELDSGSAPPVRTGQPSSEKVTSQEPVAEGEDRTIKTEMTIDAAENEQRLDASFDNVYDKGTAGADQTSSGSLNNSGPQGSPATPGNPAGNGQAEHDFLQQIEDKPDLQKFLLSQISYAFDDEDDRNVAIYIAYNLDEDGYFREDLKESAAQTGTTAERFASVLKEFQNLEPCGIGARNLAECLSRQLIELDRFDPAMKTMMENLDLMAKREFEQVKKLCGVSREDFNDMVRELKALDPRPASRFQAVLSETVVPDVMVSRKADGNWLIELNPETLPKVLVDREYYSELTANVQSDEGKDFLSDCISNANWLEKSLDQRAQTIIKVAREIVKQQDEFFSRNDGHLKPLTLKAVAKAIKMHESTVSRVTSNKYLSCEKGTFELKFFFSTALPSNSGSESVSAEAVKAHIKKMIDGENAQCVLSDDRIVRNLQETGIEIARRTVAKYREAMKIPSSVERRRTLKQSAPV